MRIMAATFLLIALGLALITLWVAKIGLLGA